MARTKVRRPMGIKILVALGLLQAAILLLAGWAFFVSRDDPDVASELQVSGQALTDGQLSIAAGVLIGLGAVQLALALGLAFRSSLARSIYGIVATVQAGASVYALIALRNLREGSIPTLVVTVAVLWFLYGTEETQEYFAR